MLLVYSGLDKRTYLESIQPYQVILHPCGWRLNENEYVWDRKSMFAARNLS